MSAPFVPSLNANPHPGRPLPQPHQAPAWFPNPTVGLDVYTALYNIVRLPPCLPATIASRLPHLPHPIPPPDAYAMLGGNARVKHLARMAAQAGHVAALIVEAAADVAGPDNSIQELGRSKSLAPTGTVGEQDVSDTGSNAQASHTSGSESRASTSRRAIRTPKPPKSPQIPKIPKTQSAGPTTPARNIIYGPSAFAGKSKDEAAAQFANYLSPTRNRPPPPPIPTDGYRHPDAIRTTATVAQDVHDSASTAIATAPPIPITILAPRSPVRRRPRSDGSSRASSKEVRDIDVDPRRAHGTYAHLGLDLRPTSDVRSSAGLNSNSGPSRGLALAAYEAPVIAAASDINYPSTETATAHAHPHLSLSPKTGHQANQAMAYRIGHPDTEHPPLLQPHQPTTDIPAPSIINAAALRGSRKRDASEMSIAPAAKKGTTEGIISLQPRQQCRLPPKSSTHGSFNPPQRLGDRAQRPTKLELCRHLASLQQDEPGGRSTARLSTTAIWVAQQSGPDGPRSPLTSKHRVVSPATVRIPEAIHYRSGSSEKAVSPRTLSERLGERVVSPRIFAGLPVIRLSAGTQLTEAESAGINNVAKIATISTNPLLQVSPELAASPSGIMPPTEPRKVIIPRKLAERYAVTAHREALSNTLIASSSHLAVPPAAGPSNLTPSLTLAPSPNTPIRTHSLDGSPMPTITDSPCKFKLSTSYPYTITRSPTPSRSPALVPTTAPVPFPMPSFTQLPAPTPPPASGSAAVSTLELNLDLPPPLPPSPPAYGKKRRASSRLEDKASKRLKSHVEAEAESKATVETEADVAGSRRRRVKSLAGLKDLKDGARKLQKKGKKVIRRIRGETD